MIVCGACALAAQPPLLLLLLPKVLLALLPLLLLVVLGVAAVAESKTVKLRSALTNMRALCSAASTLSRAGRTSKCSATAPALAPLPA
eukprot:15945-Heterococcus_DN1.PRE.1